MKTKNENQKNNETKKVNYFASASTLEAAKKLYKKLAVSLHPDKNGGKDEEYKRMNNEYDKVCRRLKRKAVEARAYVLADGEADTVKEAAKIITDEAKEFRRTLEASLALLRLQYDEREDTRRSFDYLSKVTATPLADLFDVEFVRKLYKVYTFDTVAGEMYTCIAERRKKSDKTDFTKLSERAANNIGVALNIAATLNEKTKEYYIPVYNFTPSNILKYMLTLDTYTYSLARYKAAKREEARKAKKAAKKAAKEAAKKAADAQAATDAAQAATGEEAKAA